MRRESAREGEQDTEHTQIGVRCQAKVILLASTMTPRSGPLADTNDDGARKATNAEAQGFLRLTTVATTQIR